MKNLRKLLAWQSVHNPPTVEDVRQGQTFYAQRGMALEAVLVRPEDGEALDVSNIDGLPVASDKCVTPGCCFFVVAE